MFRRFFRANSEKQLAIPLLLLSVMCVGVGVLLWAGFNAALDYTNTQDFCITCHEMKSTVYPEYQKSPHYSNASGVQATCPDCHVPQPFIPKILRKIEAVNELYHKWAGTIDTPEKFEARRLTLAKRVWARMESNDSMNCRSCHTETAIDFTKHAPAAAPMKKGLKDGQTCISCHKGIAHKLPDMSQGYLQMRKDLEALAESEGAQADSLTTLDTKKLFATVEAAKKGRRSIGSILAGTRVKVQERDGDLLKVRVSGWQQDGVGQIVYALKGQRIFSATVSKRHLDAVAQDSSEMDENTDILWHQVHLEGWMSKEGLLQDEKKLWAYTQEMYSSSCSVCHVLHEPDHFLANQWLGTLKAMRDFTPLSKGEIRILQKYLQFNSHDTAGGAHG